MSQSLVKKFLGTAGVQFLGRGLTVILGVVLARILGPEEFGIYSFILSLIAIAVIPTIAGLPPLLIREVANIQLEKRWGELLGILRWSMAYVIIVSFIVMVGLAIAIEMEWIRSDIGNLLWVGLLLVPIRGVLGRQSAILNGFRHPVLSQLPLGVLTSLFALTIVGILLFLGKHLDAHLLIQVQIIASLIGLIVSGWFLYFKIPIELQSAKVNYKVKLWHTSLLPFSFLTIISTMNNEIASVFLGFLGDEESVAYFKVAMQGVTILSLGLAAINSVIGPQIARYYRQGDMKSTQELLTKSARIGAITSIPFALVLICFGDVVVTTFFGEEYRNASIFLTILCIGHIVNVFTGSIGLVLEMTGNEAKALRSLTVSIFISIILMFILFEVYDVVGIAIAVTLGKVYCNIQMTIDVWKYTRLKCWVK